MEVGKNNTEHLILQLSSIKDVLGAASMGIWCITMQPGCKPRFTVSDEMAELLGLEEGFKLTEEEVYEAWASRIPLEEKATCNECLGKFMAGERAEITYRWSHPKLGMRIVRCGGKGHELPDGTHIMEGYHYDVTEQEATRLQDLRVIQALANVFACVFYIDLNEGTYTANVNNLPTAAKYISTSGNLKEGLEILSDKLTAPVDRAKMRKFVDLSTLNERLKFRHAISIDFVGVLLTHVRFRFLVSDRNSDGTVHHMVATVTDITEEKEAELKHLEELKVNVAANKSKTMMLQNMTHEIRTPLNAMFGFSQLLCMPDGCISDEQKAEYFNYIFNSFNMLSMLIDDVMDIADAEHGNYRIQKQTFEVNKVCQNAIQMAEMRLPSGVKMYFTSDLADDYKLDSDGRRIQQVLVNFLTNACKHTTKGEIHLHVSTTENPGKLTFSVTDTGEGIPADQATEIFERYRKANNNNAQGSGLGLHICSIIADKLNAEIKLDQTYTDGARFLFIL